MTASAIVVDGVSKRFRLYHERNQSLKAAVLRGRRAIVDEFWALQDVSFEVPVGSSFGLIGENGSGKSTLLKCMAKILRPDGGSIVAAGKLSALLELGAGFHPELSGRENVFLNGAILGLPQKELQRKFDGIVEFAGLSQFIDQPVKNYSSGMYVRLGFSVAINVDPDILLIDEVLAVGDEAFQRKCNEKFADLKAAGKTIVLVSHAMTSVHNICDTVAWLDHGQLKMVDDAARVVDEYIGNVHVDRVQDESTGGARWGSGEGLIERVELIDAAGRPTTSVRTGDHVVFRLHYEMREPIETPVFGLGIQTLDGRHVTAPTTRHSEVDVGAVAGRGFIDLEVDRLLLLPGTYDLAVSLSDLAGLYEFDHRERALRFDVEVGTPREQDGLVSLGGRWRPPQSTSL